jgi:hypothetical protein
MDMVLKPPWHRLWAAERKILPGMPPSIKHKDRVEQIPHQLSSDPPGAT